MKSSCTRGDEEIAGGASLAVNSIYGYDVRLNTRYEAVFATPPRELAKTRRNAEACSWVTMPLSVCTIVVPDNELTHARCQLSHWHKAPPQVASNSEHITAVLAKPRRPDVKRIHRRFLRLVSAME